MAVTHEGKRNVYHQRLQKEIRINEEGIEARMRWDLPILASNHKCSVSLDLPILNCKPTKACSEVCYASQGRQFYRGAIVKSLAVNRMILEEPERAARKMVDEAAGRAIRLAGSVGTSGMKRQGVYDAVIFDLYGTLIDGLCGQECAWTFK